MAGAAVGGRVGQTHALDAARVVGRELLILDAHRQFGPPVLGAQPGAAHAEFLAETFAMGRHLDQAAQRFGRTEFGIEADLFLAQDAEVVELHSRSDGRAEGNWVHAVLVAQQVGVLQRFQIADAVGRAQRPGRLVFQSAGSAPVLRAVLDAEVAFVDARNPPAGDGAAEAGRIGDEMGLAVGRALLVHGFAGNPARLLELHVTVITCGQGAHFIDHVHQDLGAELGQALAGHRIVGQHLLAGIGGSQKGREILDPGNPLGATNRHRLEVLRAHHRADAGTAGRAVQVIDDGGIEHTVLARPADR